MMKKLETCSFSPPWRLSNWKQIICWQAFLSCSRYHVWMVLQQKQTGSASPYLWLGFLCETVVGDVELFYGDWSFTTTDTETLWKIQARIKMHTSAFVRNYYRVVSNLEMLWLESVVQSFIWWIHFLKKRLHGQRYSNYTNSWNKSQTHIFFYDCESCFSEQHISLRGFPNTFLFLWNCSFLAVKLDCRSSSDCLIQCLLISMSHLYYIWLIIYFTQGLNDN